MTFYVAEDMLLCTKCGKLTALRVKCAEIVLIIPIITIYHFTIKGRYSLSSLCLALSPKMFVYTLLTQVAYWISAIV